MEGKILSINISERKGDRKYPIEKARVTMMGIEGDVHAGNWHRQVSLLADESIEKIKSKGLEINYGDFAENLTVKGIDLSKIVVGKRIKVGKDVILEVTQIGKECHEDCAIKKQIGRCIMPLEGIFTKVISGGIIKVGDNVETIEQIDSFNTIKKV